MTRDRWRRFAGAWVTVCWVIWAYNVACLTWDAWAGRTLAVVLSVVGVEGAWAAVWLARRARANWEQM